MPLCKQWSFSIEKFLHWCEFVEAGNWCGWFIYIFIVRYGERKHSVIDPRDEDKLRYEKENYARGPNRRESYGEGGGYDSSSRPPTKYPAEYPPERVGKHGGYSDTGEGSSGYPASGSHGYSGKPHHTPLVSKSLDIQTLTEILSQQTGQRVRVDNIRQSIYSLFGEDASPTVKFFVTEVIQKLQVRKGCLCFNARAIALLQEWCEYCASVTCLCGLFWHCQRSS